MTCSRGRQRALGSAATRLLLAACGWDWQAHRLRGYDREIERSGRNVENAGTDALSIELGGVSDSCECQPETPLAWLHLEKRQYDKSWGVVGRAAASGRAIDPEVLERLVNESGRDR